MTEGEGKMNMSQFIRKAALRLNVDETDARLYFDTFAAIISDGLQRGDEISLSGFGDFYLEMQTQSSREADSGPVNMRNARRKIVFVPSGKLNSLVNRW